MKRILIAGGGIGGLCTAIGLQKRGFDVALYESAPQMRAVGAGIALAANAVKGFEAFGIADAVLLHGKELGMVKLLDQAGEVITQTDSRKLAARYGTNNFVIHRADLHQVLQNQLPADWLNLGKKCVRVEQGREGVTLYFEDGTSTHGDALIAADGVHSSIRKQLIPPSEPRYAGYTCWRAVVRGYPEGLDPDSFSETWGTSGRFGIVPLKGERIYWFACINAPARSQQVSAYGVDDLIRIYRNYHPAVLALLRKTDPANLIQNDILDLEPLKRFAFGKVALLGDAAHATTPNLGQGACQAIEDAVVLANCLANAETIEAGFLRYEAKRLSRANWVIRTSKYMGKLAHLENHLLCRLRNWALRRVPASTNEKRLKFLYEVDFSG